jgi:hypothetical protein
MRFPRRKAKAARTTADDQAPSSGPPRLAERSCCCPASAHTSPATVSHLETIWVRRAMVTVVSVNTAAIRIA